jgi:hypothetical protein
MDFDTISQCDKETCYYGREGGFEASYRKTTEHDNMAAAARNTFINYR